MDKLTEVLSSFDDEEKKKLGSFKETGDSDCQYMSEVIRILYRNELQKLKHRALQKSGEVKYICNGKEYTRTKKEEITPRKKIAMIVMHEDRVRKSKTNIIDKASRIRQQYIDALISNSIRNVSSQYIKNAALA